MHLNKNEKENEKEEEKEKHLTIVLYNIFISLKSARYRFLYVHLIRSMLLIFDYYAFE